MSRSHHLLPKLPTRASEKSSNTNNLLHPFHTNAQQSLGPLKKSLKTHTPVPLTLVKNVSPRPHLAQALWASFLSHRGLLPVSVTCGPSPMLCAATLLSRVYLWSQLENKHLEQSHSVLFYYTFFLICIKQQTMGALDAQKGKGSLPAGVMVFKTLEWIFLRITAKEGKGENVF